MSNSNNQKMRRNAASPSTRQGPLRATQQFALVGGSPSRKQHQVVSRQTPTSSPTSKSSRHTKARSHSETGFVSERRSPTPNYKVEKPKALRAGGSLDNINLYLSGQWPKDGCSSRHKSQDNLLHNANLQTTATSTASSASISQHIITTGGYTSAPTTAAYDDVFQRDEQTQTPDDWEESSSNNRHITAPHNTRYVLYKRSKSVGSGDNWNLKSKDIKARLQRKDNSGSLRSSQSTQRFSPVPVITTTLTQPHSSQPIKIPIPTMSGSSSQGSGVLRGTPGKARASVEGLNTEVEKLIISATSALTSVQDDDSNNLITSNGYYFDYPDGHRAPVPCLLNNHRSVDTQTPSQHEISYHSEGVEPLSDYHSGRSSSRASTDTDDLSRPQSISPSSFMIGTLDIEENEQGDTGRGSGSTSATSPRPNNAEFRRLPPDGAEKLILVDEIATVPRMKNFLTPPLLSVGNLQPSERSAFSSLNKPTAIMANRSPLLQEIH